LKTIVRFSMKNTIAIVIVVLILVGGGLYSLSQMKMEKYPDAGIPYLNMNIVYPGASPEQVMRDIGVHLEQALAHIEGVKNVYSGANPNVFWSTLEFNTSVNMKEAEGSVRDTISKVKLPDSAGVPQITKEELDADVYSIAIYGGEADQIQAFVRDHLLPAIRSIEGIDRTQIDGMLDQNVVIQVRPEALQLYQLTLDQVKGMISANQISVPIGDLHTEDQTLPIRINERLMSVEDIQNIILTIPNRSDVFSSQAQIVTVPLREIADVMTVDPDSSITRMNDQPAVIIDVFAMGGEDSVQLVKEMKLSIAKLALPQGTQMEVLTDRTKEIEESVNTMLREVLLGAIAAVLVTLLFLRNLRSTFIAVISIPLSMFASFVVLHRLGYTLNIMTLSGIAVAIGRVVDDSIVVIENIFRRVRRSAVDERDSLLVEQSTFEVSRAITSSTLTTVAVFLPLAFVPGTVGKFFVPLAYTVVIALLFSLIVAITVVPLMSRLFLLKLKHREPKQTKLQHYYLRTLRWALSHRLLTLSIAVLLLVSSLGIVLTGQLGFNFIPTEKSYNYNVHITTPIGSNVAYTNRITEQVEDILRGRSEIERIGTRISSEFSRISFTVNKAYTDSDLMAKQLREQFAHITDAKNISLVGLGGIAGEQRLQLIVNGPNRESISQATEQMVIALQVVGGLADIKSTDGGEKPEIIIQFDHHQLASKGLNPAMVAQGLHTMLEGTVVTQAEVNNTPTNIIIQLKMEGNPSLEMLSEQTITNILGQPIPIRDIGKLEIVQNPIRISYLNGHEYVEVRATITDTNTGKVTADAQKVIDAIELPSGVTWDIVGASQEMNEGFINMGIALLVSILLIYIVMLLAFGEPSLPFIILLIVPFSVIGAVVGLYIVDEPVGMPALIGLLMLNGIVVTNAIVLLERVRTNMLAGMTKIEALMEAGSTRLRPILMTAIATIGALLPLALSTAAGLVSRALAIVVIGGLTTSTLLTLVIVPVLFSLFKRDQTAKPSSNRAVAASEQ
jgi:multidrug efflux pump subunit AcrB